MTSEICAFIFYVNSLQENERGRWTKTKGERERERESTNRTLFIMQMCN